MKKATSSLLLAVVAFAMILPILASDHPIGLRRAIQVRAALGTSSASTADTSAAPTSTHEASTSAAAATTTSAAATSAAQTTAANPAPTTTAGAATSAHPTSGEAPTTQAAATSAVATTTNSAGELVTTIVESATSSATPSPSSASNNNSSGGLSTGSIVGLSVAGGIAVLGVILFFVWKFTRKRFSDFDDNEAIKWPELNAHNTDVHALPTNNTGRAGFGPENDSDLNLTRAPSPGGAYANSIGASSVPDVYNTGDPYAVPPLPHLNPNQPYRDEPGAYGPPVAFYDPYRGSVPNAFTDTASEHGAEAYPMTQMARGRSPAPPMAYDVTGRSSPAPPMAYDVTGRSSPAPQAAMGFAGMVERSGTPTPSALGRPSLSPHPASHEFPQ